MSTSVEDLREKFEKLTVEYVNRVYNVSLTPDDMVERRGNDGNYWTHNLTNAMWIGFLVAELGVDELLYHLNMVTTH